MRKGRRILVHVAGLVALVAAARLLPVAWCGRGADKWIEGDLETQLELYRGVEELVLNSPVSRESFRTSSELFDGEWLFGSYLMAGIGFGHMALEHHELRERSALLMDKCIERILSDEVRAFDTRSWSEDPIDSLGDSDGHAAYRGYLNLLLGLRRLVRPDGMHADLNDRMTAALIRSIEASPCGLVETYPHEFYPVDNCFVIGSIGLHETVTGVGNGERISKWCTQFRKRFVDPDTGLLIQAINCVDSSPADDPRGSGSALGLLAIHYADPDLARDLYAGIKTSLAGTWLGFGAVREYPRGMDGQGDIDSGPIFFGYGLSATGFSIGGARMYDDRGYFRRLFATAHLSGAPVTRAGSRRYISGGALGNAILFAMLTAPRQDMSIQEVDR